MQNLTLEIFVWDIKRESDNIKKHGIDFETARLAFFDRERTILSAKVIKGEKRFFCIGNVDGKIISVRFVLRGSHIRIFGASKYRKEERIYEKSKR